MKNILIAGPADDPFRIPQITKAAVENSGGQVSFSLNPSDIETCDGVILPGGLPDVDPASYGERNIACGVIEPELDIAQLKMLDTAVGLDKPILGICRGHQLLNVYFGGTLIQDVADLKVHRFVPDVETLHYKPKFHHVYTIPSFHIMLNFFYFTSSIYTIKSRLRQGVRGDGRGSKPV